MSKYIVCVFDDEKTAYQGAQVLRALDNEGSIAVYEGAIISKDANGNVQIKDEDGEGPISTMGGMLLGSLLGVLGGPVGVAVGAAAGSLGGLLVDMYNAGVGDEFLDDVAASLTPGKCALVAEVDEEWTTPLDTRMEALGGTVFRSWRIDVEDDQIERDIETTRREFDELKAEWQQASDDNKAKLKAKMDAAKAKLKALDERAKKKVEALKQQTDAKLAKLNEQITKANEDFKKKLEKTRNDLKADYEQRTKKLKEAGKLTSEALT